MKFAVGGRVATLFLLIPLAVWAQEFRGSINGSVTDASGAMVAGAKVTVTETHTGTRIPTVSGASGEYNAPFLLPGDSTRCADVLLGS